MLALGLGLYTGTVFITTGVLGWMSLRTKSRVRITAALVSGIFSSLFGGVSVLLSLCVFPMPMVRSNSVSILVNSVLFTCGSFELVLGIVSSAFGCHACCKC